MKHVVNVPQLENPMGKPYLTKDSEQDAGAPASLAKYVQLMVSAIPVHKLSTGDGHKAFAILSACHKAEGTGVIELQDDHYAFLLKLLFDDAEGKRLTEGKCEGSIALGLFGYVAIAVEQALKQMQPDG